MTRAAEPYRFFWNKRFGGEYRNRTGVHGFAIQRDSQQNQRGFVSKGSPTKHEQSQKVSNGHSTGVQSEEPAAAATADGLNTKKKKASKADLQESEYSEFDAKTNEETLNRIRSLLELCDCISKCDENDASQLMTAALYDLSAGYPIPPLIDARYEAQLWADCASPAELEAYLECILGRLYRSSLHLVSRKRLFKKLWTSFHQKDRISFLKRVNEWKLS
ncbi:MAG: hypothetical protein AAGJ34_12920 [Pseudomonadota bacterium]